MRILISGFKPFLKDTINPSERLANDLKGAFPQVSQVVLPVEFHRSFEVLKQRIESENPQYILMLGQASGRKNICFEKIGLNWVQTEHPDEAQIIPRKGFLNPSRELALMTTFPVDEVLAVIKKVHSAVEVSFSAGTYVCNDLYYRVLEAYPKVKAVFIHVPLIPEQSPLKDRPTMAYEEQFQILKEVIQTIEKQSS